MIIISKYLVPKRYLGITIWPFIFLKNRTLKDNLVLINHERIHIRQQIELLIIPFYILYVLEFLIGFIQFKSWQQAYRNISFEREAYKNENDFNYLKSRSFWDFIKYL
ncbi:hypothetical protein BZARG_1591 [Bizionia argentinensis JUB59]|uniref:DUF4157 domain-containing protein n=1 Tax=Bizionia argentinensis JUB59 TaxID=1046627 RepID=G2EA85_9FLAO|nr:hypothetical protein [Bizionia argentinensis]EGV44714.1 hypothetical protein BZARG_1591 [Bizionia argentinensis JUB59]